MSRVIRYTVLTGAVMSLALWAGPAKVAYAQAMVAPATSPATAPGVIRIKAGLAKPLTDDAGQVWQADTGFTGGDVIERPDVVVTGTDQPKLFQSEHYDMTAFGQTVPNGKYTVKLYIAETYEDVTAVGQRVFGINVEGQELKDFDPFKEAGGARKAIVKSFDVEVTDGKLDITFTAGVQAPAVNAIEIIPRP